MATAIILKSTFPVEPPSREMYSLFVIFNQKCNFIGASWRLRCLLSGALMLKRFVCKHGLSLDFYGSKFGGFLNRRPSHCEFDCTKSCINRKTTFKPLSVRPVGWPRKRKRKKMREKQVTKSLYFTTTWRRHFATDLYQIWRSYQHNHACQVWFQNIHWFFQPERWKNSIFPFKRPI